MSKVQFGSNKKNRYVLKFDKDQLSKISDALLDMYNTFADDGMPFTAADINSVRNTLLCASFEADKPIAVSLYDRNIILHAVYRHYSKAMSQKDTGGAATIAMIYNLALRAPTMRDYHRSTKEQRAEQAR